MEQKSLWQVKERNVCKSRTESQMRQQHGIIKRRRARVEEEVQEALKHFGITDEEIKENGFWIVKNTETSRRNIGIRSILDTKGN